MTKHIYPVYDQLLSKENKEKLLNQQAKCIWLTGLSGSGKTAIGKHLEQLLQENGKLSTVLDGDNIRDGLNKNLGFSVEDRAENIRRIAEINKLLLNSGVITINCFVSPTQEIRDTAKAIIGEKDFLEIYINTPIEVCEQRDVKGLYAKARAGEIKNFTGISSPFEEPKNPALKLSTINCTPLQSAQKLFDFLAPHLKYTS